MRLVFPLPFGPTTKLNGVSRTLAFRSALKFRKLTDAITFAAWVLNPWNAIDGTPGASVRGAGFMPASFAIA
jgi:hypothetical protein